MQHNIVMQAYIRNQNNTKKRGIKYGEQCKVYRECDDHTEL